MALECKWEHVSPLSQCMMGVGVCLCVVFSVCDGSYMTHLLCNCLILSLKITLHWREWMFYFYFLHFVFGEKKKKNIFRNVLLHLCEHVNYTVLGFYYNIPAFFYNKPLPMALLLQLACCERWSCHAWFALSLLRLLLTQEVSFHLKHHCVFFMHAGVNVNEVQVTQQGRLIWSVQFSSVHVRVTFGALSNWTRVIFNIQVLSFLIFRTLLPFYIMI